MKKVNVLMKPKSTMEKYQVGNIVLHITPELYGTTWKLEEVYKSKIIKTERYDGSMIEDVIKYRYKKAKLIKSLEA